VVLVGHRGHPEVEGTLGQWLLPAQQQHLHLVEHEADVAALPLTPDASVAYVTQTTLSVDDTRKVVDALRQRFAGISAPRRDDICYATQNRQDAVRALAAQVDGVLVVGSVNSSNSNRLRELAEQCGKPSYLIDSAEDIQAQWLTAWQVVGVTAGASAPEVLVAAVIARLQALLGADTPVTELAGRAETIAFSLPRELAARTA
jgi:4-hydroxy-3-methylbut-2-enyl diphosphate reductase